MGDADAHRHPEFGFGQGDPPLADMGEHPLGNDPALFRPSVGQCDDELLAAEAADDVSGASAVLQSVRQDAKRGIADIVTETIVDILEMIDVDYEDDKSFALELARRPVSAPKSARRLGSCVRGSV